jgi:hypothetical protein
VLTKCVDLKQILAFYKVMRDGKRKKERKKRIEPRRLRKKPVDQRTLIMLLFLLAVLLKLLRILGI